MDYFNRIALLQGGIQPDSDRLLRQVIVTERERNGYFRNFVRMLTGVQDYKQLTYILESTLRPFIGYEHCTIFLLDNATQWMNNIGESDTFLQLFPFKQSLADKVQTYLRNPADSENVESLVYYLYNGSDMLGSCVFLFPKGYVPTMEMNEVLSVVTDLLSAALVKAIVIEKSRVYEDEMKILHKMLSKQNDHQELERQTEEGDKIYLAEELGKIESFNAIVGESDCLKNVFTMVSKVAATNSSVLILGETGTGKELIARAVHNNSPRKSKPMVKVNCAALPANLIESELFGHEKGSFTGATERRLGKFELANKGTLFLDEIGEMPIDLQVKLLRALQEKEIERVGGKETIKVDVRIIAATNRDLQKEIAEGRFRSDLFYRLNIFPIALPPLRERKQDIEMLALHFVNHFNEICCRNIDSISNKAIETLMRYDWPGNIRELEHLIERSVLMTKGNVLTEVLLPSPMEQMVVKAQFEEFTLMTIDENEKDYILKVLRHCRGRIAGNGGAAQILGVPATTLNSKIKRLGIKREHISPEYQGSRVPLHLSYAKQ